jgi:hypothetical protein
MAVTYVWPGSLPQAVRVDYSENAGALILRTPMDSGPAKLRRRGQRPDVMKVGFYMTPAQVTTLETFVKSTLKGTARFGFPHPRTNAAIEARIIPTDDGELYSASYVGPGIYAVDMQIEVLP